HPRQRRQPGDDGGARRGHAAPPHNGLHARHGPGHPGRRARHSGDGGDELDGHRADRGGLRRRRDRRPRVHAGRLRRCARRRRAQVDRDLRVPGARDAPDLPHRDRGARAPAARPLRRSTGVSGRLVLALALGATVLAPLVAPTYHVLLMLPFMAYAVALLGLNLLFGYTGLVSFGHALFLGVGAYTGAFLTSVFKVRSMEVILVAAAALGALVAAPVAGLCLKTIRDNPTKAETLGIGVARYRWCAFVISAVYAAVGGALLGPPTGNVDPTLAYWTQSGNIVFMTLLGGFASFFGPVLGAFVFIYLQDWVMSVVPFWRLIFGAILAAIVIAAPGGLAGLWVRRPSVEASSS